MDTDTKSARGAQASKDECATNESNKSGENEMAQASQPAAPSPASDSDDRILKALNTAIGVVPDTDTEADNLAKQIGADLSRFLNGMVPKPPRPIPEDKCDSPDAAIAPYCNQEKLSLDTAQIAYTNAKVTAAGALRTANNAWKQAKSQYKFDVANAELVLQGLKATALTTYDQKNNPDSHSRSLYLYFAMKQSIATAVQAYETSAATAAATLAGAAGNLLTAYVTYVDAINAAQSQHLIDELTAVSTFWQKVEAVRDTV